MARLEGLRTHDGRVLPPNVKSWITRTAAPSGVAACLRNSRQTQTGLR
jgi:hypothetical protein